MRRIHHLGHYCKEFSQIIEAYFLTECVQSLRNNWTVTFVAYCEELRFQHTCQYLHSGEVEEYVEAVIGGCVEKGPHVLKYLFQLRNAQGQTPLHVAVASQAYHWVVGLIPVRESGENAECLNMPDSRGWTALHGCASQEGLYYNSIVLLEDGRANVNDRVAPMSWRSGSVHERLPYIWVSCIIGQRRWRGCCGT